MFQGSSSAHFPGEPSLPPLRRLAAQEELQQLRDRDAQQRQRHEEELQQLRRYAAAGAGAVGCGRRETEPDF